MPTEDNKAGYRRALRDVRDIMGDMQDIFGVNTIKILQDLLTNLSKEECENPNVFYSVDTSS